MDVKALFYELSIGDKPLGIQRMALIESIEIEDSMTGADSMVITISDPDFLFIEDDIFVEEKAVKFKGGWTGGDTIEFEGYISLIDIDFPDTGSPELVITCMDKSHLLNRQKKKKTWDNKRPSEVAKEIFASYGLKADVDMSDKVEKTITQSNTTDIQHIIDLAKKEKEDFIVYIEKGTGYYKKMPTLATPQMTLWYRNGTQDIKSFAPSINKEVKQESENSDVDDSNKTVVNAKSTKKTTVQGTDTVKAGTTKTVKGITYKYINSRWVKQDPARRVSVNGSGGFSE